MLWLHMDDWLRVCVWIRLESNKIILVRSFLFFLFFIEFLLLDS